jgi:hypothetical protein
MGATSTTCVRRRQSKEQNSDILRTRLRSRVLADRGVAVSQRMKKLVAWRKFLGSATPATRIAAQSRRLLALYSQ